MSLTREQAFEQANRSIELDRKAESLEPGVKRAFQFMFLFLVVGIFFLPCLVIALICFALYHFGKKEVNSLRGEVQRLESIPEVLAALHEIIETGRSNP